ncbi:MAG: marine proteobacterial sortase target protein, partial [Xanthomonadales bacterium]|nr:marine proteobacterial sortase target protein [Xanthomonadales bacterium]
LLIVASVLVLLLIVRVETANASQAPWGIEALADGVRSHAVALNTDSAVEVSGLAARVQVRQHFRNDGAGWKEAVYRFPLPDGAAVDRLRIEAGGRVLEGEIRERTEARRQYRQARQSGQRATLVEQQRPNQFETRLANIGPGEDVWVEIGFLARVDYADGSFSLRLPMTFTPRWEGPGYSAADAKTVRTGGLNAHVPNEIRSYGAPHPVLTAATDGHRLSLEVLLHSGMALASLESRYHDVDIEAVSGGYRVALTDAGARTDRVFALDWTPGYGRAPESSLLTWDGGDAVYALLMLAPPLPDAIAPRPREVVFVIDTSGSMAGASLQQARAALRLGLEFLGPDDRFNLIRFASDTERLFEVSAPADAISLAQAEDFIDALAADGGTNMGPALQLAMSLPAQAGLLRQIVFVTDGSVGNEQDLLLQVADRLGNSRLFTVSIGSAPNSGFMRKAAEVGRGSHSQIAHQAEVGQRMATLWGRIENPAVQDLCVDWGTEAEFYPEVIPDLYAGEPLWLYARLPHAPREVLVCGELDGRYWETLTAPAAADGGPDLATLWARSKIEALEDSRIFGIDPAVIRRQVLRLALDFGLLTPYTSLVAVDRTPARPASAALHTEDVPSLLPAGSAGSAAFAQTATGWPLQLALSLLALLVATAMLLFTVPPRGLRARPRAEAPSPDDFRSPAPSTLLTRPSP